MHRSNDQWIADLQEQQDAALVELRNVLVRNLRKALTGRSGVDHAFIEDAAQDSVLRILERLNQYEGRSQFITWATSISIRVALCELRRSRWKDISLDEILPGGGSKLGQPVASSPSAEEILQRDSLIRVMREMIDSVLTEKQRVALLAELKGMPQDEIARHLGSNRNAVYKLTHDARKNLRAGLEAAGYTAADILFLNSAAGI